MNLDITKKASLNFCESRLIFSAQDGLTCWFNALLIAMFYSQYSKSKLHRASHKWNTNVRILKIFHHMLHYKYVKSDKPDKDRRFFDTITPEYILKQLSKFDKKTFMFDKYDEYGFYPHIYVRSLYELLDVSCVMINVLPDYTVMYDVYNAPPARVEFVKQGEYGLVDTDYYILDEDTVDAELASTPEILIIRHLPQDAAYGNLLNISRKYDYYELYDEANIEQILSMEKSMI
jgi:hypothetical protein